MPNNKILNTQEVVSFYETLDITGFPFANPKILQKLQQRKMLITSLVNALDNETFELLSQHDTPKDHQRVGAIIKAMYA